MHPVGARPDGVSWTGFVSESPDGTGGYALLFRELAKSPDFTLDLSPLFGDGSVFEAEVIAGRGKVQADDATLRVSVAEPLDYIWVKIRSTRA